MNKSKIKKGQWLSRSNIVSDTTTLSEFYCKTLRARSRCQLIEYDIRTEVWYYEIKQFRENKLARVKFGKFAPGYLEHIIIVYFE